MAIGYLQGVSRVAEQDDMDSFMHETQGAYLFVPHHNHGEPCCFLHL